MRRCPTRAVGFIPRCPGQSGMSERVSLLQVCRSGVFMIRRPMVGESGVLIWAKTRFPCSKIFFFLFFNCKKNSLDFIPSFNCVIENICVVLTLLKVIVLIYLNRVITPLNVDIKQGIKRNILNKESK